MNSQNVKKKTSIGGQALIEGVMMRGPEKTSMAVRQTTGEIVTESWPTSGKKRAKILKLPFIRGVFNFIDSMAVGYRCLMRSAEIAGLDEEDTPKPKKAMPPAIDSAVCQTHDEQNISESGDTAESTQISLSQTDLDASDNTVEKVSQSGTDQKPDSKKGMFESFGMTLILIVSLILGVAIAIGLFMTLPTFLFNRLCDIFPDLNNRVWRAVTEGIMRILLFVGYIFAVSFMKDIRRVFMYHGAEHKTIFCYEKGEQLTVENVRRQQRFHPRCGTSFMILMLIVGIVVSMFITASNPIIRTGIKLLTVPLIVSIGYELIKLAGRSDHWLVRAISAPGLWLQRVTTREPTDDMIEVAIKAFEDVIPGDPDADKL